MHIALCSSKSLYKYCFIVSLCKNRRLEGKVHSATVLSRFIGEVIKKIHKINGKAKRQLTQLSWLLTSCPSQSLSPCYPVNLSSAWNALYSCKWLLKISCQCCLNFEVYMIKSSNSTFHIIFWMLIFLHLSSALDCMLDEDRNHWIPSDRHSGNCHLMNKWNLWFPPLWVPVEISIFNAHLAFKMLTWP